MTTLRATPSDTAILLFAHAAEHEAQNKSFAAGQRARASQKVAAALLEHTQAVIRQANIRLFAVYTPQQRGDTFGERLTHAFQDAFDAGYQRVICVGSDCPTLTTADLLQAQEALQEHGMVAGPAADGGAYLIGMHVNCFAPQQFAALTWQTGQVLQELIQYASRQQACPNRLCLLHEKTDIDGKEDLYRALEQLPDLNGLKQLLISILYRGVSRAYAFRRILREPPGWCLRHLHLRPPPLQVLPIHSSLLRTK